MIYNCLIADDNVIERDVATMLVKKIPQLNTVAVCEDGFEAADALASLQVDIVFCDIDMPGFSGISLLKSLRNPPAFVFITSYSDYAAESFDLDVVDFIVKPVTFERLLKAVNKTTEYIQLRRVNNSINLADTAAETVADDHFFIKESHGITKLKYADVLYVESMGDFSKIHTVQGNTHVILSGLKNLEAQIPTPIFKRVHKQYIINISHVNTVSQTDVLLLNKKTVPLSQLYRQQLLDAFVNKELIKRNIA